MKKLVGIAVGVVLLGLTSGCAHYGYAGDYYVESVGVSASSGSYYDYHPYYYYNYGYSPYHYYRAPYYSRYGW